MEADSQFIRFTSCDPLNHLARVLGIVQRMGFLLQSMSVRPAAQERSSVVLLYRPVGTLTADTFVARVSVLPGIEDLSHGSESEVC